MTDTDFDYMGPLRDRNPDSFIHVEVDGKIVHSQKVGNFLEDYDTRITEARRQGAQLFKNKMGDMAYTLESQGAMDEFGPAYAKGFFDALMLMADNEVAPINNDVIDFTTAPE